MRTHRTLTGIVLAALAVLLGCATPALAGNFLDKDKRHREYAEPSDEAAVVYVVRKSGIGRVVKFWAFADDRFIGLTRGPGYFFAELPPGKHLLWSKAENVSAVELELEAGKTYFLKQGVTLGFNKARVKLAPLDAGTGRKLIQKLPYVRVTEEGRARGEEISANRYERVRAKRKGTQD